jgi:hypothetical protein
MVKCLVVLVSLVFLGVVPVLGQSTTGGATDMPSLISNTTTAARSVVFPVMGASLLLAALVWGGIMLWKWMSRAVMSGESGSSSDDWSGLDSGTQDGSDPF